MPAAPVLFVLVGLAATGIIPGIKDPEAGKPVRSIGAAKQKGEPKHAARLRMAAAAAALILILAGIFNGSARDVMIKAIHICTECIGLG